jgi:transcriptional regulator with XRE-family HTH domain
VRSGRKKSSEQPWAHLAPEIGRRLRNAREKKRTTREKLGNECGVAASTIAKLESGRIIEPGFFTIWAICRTLDYEMGELLDTLDPNEVRTDD